MSQPTDLWICHSPQGDPACDGLRQHLESAGFQVGCAHRLLAGTDVASEEARGLREARWVVVLSCPELTADKRWSEKEAVLTERAPTVVVVRLRSELKQWPGFRLLPNDHLGPRLLLRLQGAQSPTAQRYRDALRKEHSQLPLWSLRADAPLAPPHSTLQEIYVPPQLQAVPAEGQPPPKPCEPAALLTQEAQRLLVRGEPGLGKTTLLRHLLLLALEQPAMLPVWLKAASVPEDADPEQHLLTEIERQDPAWRLLLEDALAAGRVLLLVDGLDEVAGHYQQRLSHGLCNFAERWPGTRMVMTTRPQAQVQVPKAQVLDLLGLNRNRGERLWSKLGQATGQERPAFSDRWERWSPHLRELTQIPLLLILLRQVELGEEGLRSRVQLYHEAVELLQERWRHLRSEGVAPPPHKHDLREALALVALQMQDDEKESLPKAKLERLLAKHLGSPAAARQALHDARAVGLLQPAEPGALGFIHATFREYLAALALLDDADRWQARLPRLRSAARWREVLYLAVAQQGIVEDDAAAADRLLREVLEGEPATMQEVLYGPLCLVGDLLADGVGESETLQAEVLERMRAVLWLEYDAVDRVLVRLSQKPELPWDPRWHGAVKGSERRSYSDIGPRLTAWLARRSEAAEAACEAALESPMGSDLAALGLVMAGNRSLRLLDALAAGDNWLVQQLTRSALRGAAQQGLDWPAQLLATLRQRLGDSDARARVGAAWLLGAAGLCSAEVIEVLWHSATAGKIEGQQKRSREVLQSLAARERSVAEDLFTRWQQAPLSSEWLTEFLKLRSEHRALVMTRLLDLAIGEDLVLGDWAVKQLGEHSSRLDEELNVAIRRLVLEPAQRGSMAQSRLDSLFNKGSHPTEAWVKVLRARMSDSNPPEIRYRAGRMAADLRLDELAIPGLIACFARDEEDAVFGLAQVRGRQPSLHESILEQTRQALAVLPPQGCYEAAKYLHRWKRLPWEELVKYGEAFLPECTGHRLVQVAGELCGAVDSERLCLALVPLVDEQSPEKAQQLLGSLRPQSAEVLIAFLDRISAVGAAAEVAAEGEFADSFRKDRWVELLAEMLWRTPTLVTKVMERLDDPASRKTALSLLRVASTGLRKSSEESTAAARALRQGLLERLATEPPHRTLPLLNLLSWEKDQRVRAALDRCLCDSRFVNHWLTLAWRLEHLFAEPGPLIKLERKRLVSANPADRLSAARELFRLGCLSAIEAECLVDLLAPSIQIAVRVGAAELLIRIKAASPHIEQTGAALLDCMRHPAAGVGSTIEDAIWRSTTISYSPRWSIWPRALGEQAALLLFELPTFREALIGKLLLWLHEYPQGEKSHVAVMVLQELRVDPELVVPACIHLLQTTDARYLDSVVALALKLGVSARRLLSTIIAVLLSMSQEWRVLDVRCLRAEVDCGEPTTDIAQLRFLQVWHSSYRLEDLAGEGKDLLCDAANRQSLLDAFDAALGLRRADEVDARCRVARARFALSGATEADLEILATYNGCAQWHALVSLAPGNQSVVRAWAARLTHRGESFLDALWPLVEAEKAAPGSARVHLEPLQASWLTDNDPSFRLMALQTLEDLGWLTPAHATILSSLLMCERRGDANYAGSAIRRIAGALLVKHFPEGATAVHVPLLEMISQGWIGGIDVDDLQACIETLLNSKCSRERIVAALTEWLTRYAGRSLFCLRNFTDFLRNQDLLSALEDVYGDWGLCVIYDYSPAHVKDFSDQLQLEDGDEVLMDGTKIQRLAAVPGLLCRALVRRLGLPAETLQALWHDVTLPSEPSSQVRSAMTQVLRCATNQAELRPFAAAVVKRWESAVRGQVKGRSNDLALGYDLG